MSIITQNEQDSKRFDATINNFFNTYKIGKLLKAAGAYKEKGVPCVTVFRLVFMLVFSGKNLFMTLENSSAVGCAKDVVYRFLNSMTIHWEHFLMLLSSAVIREISMLTSEKRVSVLILDDSLYNRNRSKAVELLARVKDHTDGGFKKGFRMLTMGWSDGNSFIPICFSLLSSSNEKNRLQEASTIDKRTLSGKRRINAIRPMPEMVLEMLRKAKEAAIIANYVLFDSWFATPSALLNIDAIGYKTIAMVKKSSKIHYSYGDEQQPLSRIYKSLKKRRGKAKWLSSALVKLSNAEGVMIEAKIVFVRNRSNKKDWLAVISNDTTLPEDEIIRIYGKRWDIEVFFKMCKSYLKLSKEFQGRSYDLLVAHTTIVFSRYIMLVLESRNAKDERTFGALFFLCCDELADITFTQAIMIMLEMLVLALQEKFMLAKAAVSSFIDDFIAALPAWIKGKLSFLYCES